MIEAIKLFLTDTLGAHFGVMICSMIPIIELRGAIPLGAWLEMPWWQNYLLSVLGNMIPVPFILLFINKFIAWMSRSKIKFFNKIGTWLAEKAEKNRGKIEKYSFWGVCLFVAVPLPVTGAWTGSLVAATIGIKGWKAFLSCLLGVMIAGVIMTLASYGVVAAFQIFA
ncbi:MAG: small multi-drug export protein [Clostridia bacterium]|nr:small multi-drug export protein [Clostridia bacterium]